jgi:hypothetical protein
MRREPGEAGGSVLVVELEIDVLGDQLESSMAPGFIRVDVKQVARVTFSSLVRRFVDG